MHTILKYIDSALVWVVFFTLDDLKGVVQRYLYSDWEFLIWLLVMVSLNIVLHTWALLKANKLSRIVLDEPLRKVLLYMSVLIACNVMSRYTIHGEPNNSFSWLPQVVYLAIMGAELIEFLSNLQGVSKRQWVRELTKNIQQRIMPKDEERDNP